MTPKKPEATLNADAVLYAVREKIVFAMPTIIEKIIEKAKGGSYLHAKFLLEFADAGPAPPANNDEGSLAKMLLKELHENTTGDDSATGAVAG